MRCLSITVLDSPSFLPTSVRSPVCVLASQEGAIALHLAVERYDPGRGVRFFTYADWSLRAAFEKAVSVGGSGSGENKIKNDNMEITRHACLKKNACECAAKARAESSIPCRRKGPGRQEKHWLAHGVRTKTRCVSFGFNEICERGPDGQSRFCRAVRQQSVTGLCVASLQQRFVERCGISVTQPQKPQK